MRIPFPEVQLNANQVLVGAGLQQGEGPHTAQRAAPAGCHAVAVT